MGTFSKLTLNSFSSLNDNVVMVILQGVVQRRPASFKTDRSGEKDPAARWCSNRIQSQSDQEAEEETKLIHPTRRFAVGRRK